MRAPQPPKQSLTSKSSLANPEGKIDKKLEPSALALNLMKCELLQFYCRSKESIALAEPLANHKAFFNFNKESLRALPQSHRCLQVTLMKEQVQNLNREL